MTSHREIVAPGKGVPGKSSAWHDTTKQREELYGLKGQYLDAYNAVVQPRQVFPISYYTLRCWTPVLGAVGFWLLATVQQMCYRRSETGDWCIVDQATLADEANIGVRTLQRYLHGEDYVRSGLAHWIRPSSRQAGKTKRLYRYEVALDAPLVRPHQHGLAQYLYEHGGQPGASLADVRPALEHLIGLGRLKHQTDMLDEYAAHFEPPAGWREDGFYPTVGDVVGTLGLAKSAKDREMLGLCSEAHHALTGADWLCTQYFRRRLMPLLGHKLALLVVQLRSRCFWNESGKRDVVSDIGTQELARLAGCTDGWIRAICDSPGKGKVSPDGCEQQAELAGLFFRRMESGVGKRPVFHVMLREPIAPQDEDSYLKLLEMQVGNQSVLPLWPELEKVVEGDDPIEDHETHVVAELDETNACGGVSNACGGGITEDETHVVAELDETNACGGVSNACGGVHVKHLKQIREQTFEEEKQPQHRPANPETSPQPAAAAPNNKIVEFLEDEVGIHGNGSLTEAFDLVSQYEYTLPELQAILVELQERERRGNISNLPGLFMTKLRSGDNPAQRYMHQNIDGDVSMAWKMFRGEL